MTQLNGRAHNGRFLRGNRAGPGRPVGSRNRLATKFLDDLHKQWRKSGADVLARVAHDDPVQLMKAVAAILPRELDSTLAVNVSLFAEAENLDQAFELALRHIQSRVPPLIEAKTIKEAADADIDD